MEKMEKLYYFAFSNFFGIGPERFAKLLSKFESAEEAYKRKREELAEVLGENLTEKFLKFKERFDIEKEFEKLEKKGIKVVAKFEEDYPKSILNIPDPPICLYVKGDYDSFGFEKEFFFAVVGTRKPTSYGRNTAFNFAFSLAKAGACIVSGMAMGIDSEAHKGALEAGGKTIAVLGCGVDIVYPAVNRGLYNKIIESGGLVISEFPPGTLVQKGLFIARNRIISGLSKGVLVVEGGETSGSLITARYAAEQGKDVFAIPGRITDKMAKAPNLLIKQGAFLVESVEEIIEQYLPEVKLVEKEFDLTEEEKKVIESFDAKEADVGSLKLKTGFSISKLLSLLSVLEIKGVLRVEGERIRLIK